MTLTELAQNYVGAQRSLIFEFCGNTQKELRKLREVLETEINPLLVQHGAQPVDPEAAASDSELENDDIEYDEAGNTWSG